MSKRRELEKRQSRLLDAVKTKDPQTVDRIIEAEWPCRALAKTYLESVGVQLPRKRHHVHVLRANRLLPVLADLLNTSDSYGTIGNRHAVSRQYVGQVRKQAEAAGITFKA